jgi:hypothetical protein
MAAVVGVGHGVRRPCRATAVVAGLSLQASAVAGDGRGRRLAAVLAGGGRGVVVPKSPIAWAAGSHGSHGGLGCRGRWASAATAVR